MNDTNSTSDAWPSPELLAAWADDELSLRDRAAIDEWLAAHPDAAREAESLGQLTRLYRDHASPLPSLDRWQETFAAIEPRVHHSFQANPTARWTLLTLLLGIGLTAAAALAGVVLTRSWFSPPASLPGNSSLAINKTKPPDPEDEPFEVATAGEVNILRMDAADADRVVTGQPVMGTMEFVTSADQIDLLHVAPDPRENGKIRLEQRWGMPMIVVARTDEAQEEP